MKMNSIEKFLSEIKKIPEVMGVYLFGSYAKNETKLISDIDLAVIVDNPSKEIEANIVSHSSKNLDIVLFHRLPLHIKYEVLKYGKELYVKDDDYMANVRLNIIKYYLEFSHIYRNIEAEVLK
ncbi:MAG: nucleotidyltransferase domain-containing protein [candidate division WOR-3 bacterium]